MHFPDLIEDTDWKQVSWFRSGRRSELAFEDAGQHEPDEFSLDSCLHCGTKTKIILQADRRYLTCVRCGWVEPFEELNDVEFEDSTLAEIFTRDEDSEYRTERFEIVFDRLAGCSGYGNQNPHEVEVVKQSVILQAETEERKRRRLLVRQQKEQMLSLKSEIRTRNRDEKEEARRSVKFYFQWQRDSKEYQNFFNREIRKQERVEERIKSKVVCPFCSSQNTVKFGFFNGIDGRVQRYWCLACAKRFSESSSGVKKCAGFFIKVGPVRLSQQKRDEICNSLLSGNGIRQTSRLLKMHPDTITPFCQELKKQTALLCKCGKPLGSRHNCEFVIKTAPRRMGYLVKISQKWREINQDWKVI